METWKQIKEYEGIYEVSSLGNIKILERLLYYNHSKTKERFSRIQKEQLLKKGDVKGYNSVCLTKNGKAITKRVCRIVALNFIPNPENKPFVNHKDGNKKNDNIDNLEWVTGSENMIHAVKIGLQKIKYGRDCANSIKVRCLTTGKIYDTITDYSNDNNIDSSNISRALSGVYKNNHNVEYYEG